ncbi:MAG: geranylgeranylglyceryl/heptaprenylglyceryl phosphate synthase [Flavobacteriales bacterium]|jgi:putative glycerol-1-phosphate prenyltransferase|nr:geranylgeranylglyceryl/heptaprenylglyceryl phosphate synthase [Flavobacteriales bacterium]
MQFADFYTFFPADRKHLVLLVDPDTFRFDYYADLLKEADGLFSAIFLGGSHLSHGDVAHTLKALRGISSLPILLFPGSVTQVTEGVDAILFLSLLSGRNADFLIGQHIWAAPKIKAFGTPVMPTAYLLVNSGAPTTASYISGTQPIPADKPQITAATALAGEMLGLRVVYIDGGSGADGAVPPETLAAVRAAVAIPIITGGGLRSAQGVADAFNAGADVVVLGNALETEISLLAALKKGIWQK